MDTSMYSLNSLKTMEIIDINTGCKLGYIKDMVIDYNNYKIISILIPNNKNSGWFSKNNDIEIPWSQITKIGVDVILIDGKGILYNND